MLAAGTAEQNHQIFKAALLIVADAGIHKRKDAGEKLMHALLLSEIVDDRSVFTGESLEARFAARIGQAAAIKNEAATVAAVVLGQGRVKGKTEKAHARIHAFGSRARA